MKTTGKLTEEQIANISVLAEQGYTDTEIAKMFGNVSDGCIQYHRKKLGIKSRFTYEKISKMDHKKMEELFNSGLSDYKIAKELGVKPCSVFNYRKYHNIGMDRNLKYNKAIKLTDFQRQLLIGTLLGDSSLEKANTNPRVSCTHGIKQKEYCEYKTGLLESLGAHSKCYKRKTIDNRTGLYYEECTMRLPANPEFVDLYYSFYPEGHKVFPLDLLNDYSEVSLAFHYMDDGYKIRGGYALSTNCFDKNSLQKFVSFLKERFGLEASVWNKENVIYIHKRSSEKFKSLVEPYFCDCMRYKL